MRPKKRILVLDADERRRGILGFVLNVNGYHVEASAALPEYWPSDEWFDLVILVGAHQPEQFTRARKASPNMPLLVVSDAGVYSSAPPLLLIDVLIPPSTPSLELLGRIKAMSARRRGPRKGSTRMPVAAVGAACAAPALAGKAG